MPQKQMTDIRSGPRYIAAFPIRAEWDTADGVHIVSDGETENIGPDGTLVHLQRELPPVGSRVSLLVARSKPARFGSSIRKKTILN